MTVYLTPKPERKFHDWHIAPNMVVCKRCALIHDPSSEAQEMFMCIGSRKLKLRHLTS